MLLGKLLSQFFYLLFRGFALLNLGLKGWYIIGRDILLPSLAMLRPTVYRFTRASRGMAASKVRQVRANTRPRAWTG